MRQYKNLGRNSSVRTFSIGADYIDVQFDEGRIYRYSYKSAGNTKVEQMKKLAVEGCGLNSYIMCYAKNDFEK